MDSFLVEYLSSEKAFVLIGSGPSIAMGYPNWEQLSAAAINLLRLEFPEMDIKTVEKIYRAKDYPAVFDKVATVTGMPRLLQVLKEKLIPPNPSLRNAIYSLITRWPVPVFMTTNYDDELQRHLVDCGESYIKYDNSEDHFAHLTPDCRGAIFKLHGDLTSEKGLVLTSRQYAAISDGPDWEYWRIKMTSVFQMQPVVIIGHSLTDANIQHVLRLAKKGSGVDRPICWLAPYIGLQDRQNYLLNHRIHVIPYDNSDGKHHGLLRLLQTISDFVPPRTTVQIQQNIAAVSQSPLGSNAAAPGFFVFNRLAKHGDIDKMRDEALLGAVQASLSILSARGCFALEEVPLLLGWPSEVSTDNALLESIRRIAVRESLFVAEEGHFRVRTGAEKVTEETRKRFDHLRQRFRNSLRLRIRRDFPEIDENKAETISDDIDASLAGYFREGGLTLASSIFTRSGMQIRSTMPSSILRFIRDASTRYTDYQSRLAFFKTSVDAFIRATDAERDYLGRISQGFFSLHALGLFGDVAASHLHHAKQTVWLIDSDSQIAALAIAAPANVVFSNCFTRLKMLGIRFFTTKSVANETWQHLDFALKLIRTQGETSPMVIAGAKGDAPYSRSNRFLQGFIAWQTVGNPPDWQSYLYAALECRSPVEDDLYAALFQKGIEVIDLQEWPGFDKLDFAEREEDIGKLVELGKSTSEFEGLEEFVDNTDLIRKAKPEAESLLVVKNERNGRYHMLSEAGQHSPSWFISHTSILNLLVTDKVTWQPESFMRFTERLCPSSTSKEAADRAFEILLWQLASSGVSTLSEEVIEQAFGGLIDQSRIQAEEQILIYESTISEKYGESQEQVLERLHPIRRPMASLQLAHEMAEAESKRRQKAEEASNQYRKRAERAEKDLSTLNRYKKKVESRKAKAKRVKNRQKTGKKKAKKKKVRR